MNKFLPTVICVLGVTSLVRGHGRLWDPPGRSTIWRRAEEPEIAPYTDIVEENWNDNQLFCGGFQHQQSLDGKCGVCGDAWDDPDPKANEALGTYGKGIIVKQYTPGSWITVMIDITAHHMGYFEFRLCPWNNPTVPITQECLNRYLLENKTPYSPQWMLPNPNAGSWMYEVEVKLPDGLECDQCVLQWRYHAGNSWGCDEDGKCDIGLGPQEEFYGCADIAIGTGPTNPPPEYQGVSSTTASTTTTKAATDVVTTTTKASTTTTTTSKPVETTTTTTSNENGLNDGPCPGAGAGNHKHDCDTFYRCSGSDEVFFDCPPGTVYNEEREACDHPYNVPEPCGTK